MEGTGQGSQTVIGGQPEETLSQQDVRSMPRRNNWSCEGDEALVQMLLDECSGYKTDAWVRVWNAYQKKTKEDITLFQLKSRWKTLKKLYRLYSSLVNKSGWSWDFDNHRPTPGCPTVWEKIIKLNKDYKVARDEPFPLFWMIHDLAGSSTATGQYARCTGSGQYASHMGGGVSWDHLVMGVDEGSGSSTATGQYASHTGGGVSWDHLVMGVDEGSSSSDSSVHEVEKDTVPAQRAGKKVSYGDNASAGSKKKQVHNTQILEAIDRLVELSDRRSRIMEQCKAEDDSFSFKICMEKLSSLPDVSDEELCVAAEALKSPENRIFFMTMRLSAIKYWLSLRVKEFRRQD